MYLWLDATTYARFQDVTKSFDSRTKELAARIASSENAGNQGGFGYVEFLLQSASHPLREKIDVVDTLADHFAAYSFGQEPPTFTYEMMLINSKQSDQANNMFRLYRNILRATALASLRTEVHLQYNGMIVSGAVLGFSWSLSAMDESYCPASFSILVRKITLLEDTPGQYDGSSVQLTTSDAVKGVLAKLIPTRVRGVAGTSAQLVPEEPVAPPPPAGPGTPAAAPSTAAAPLDSADVDKIRIAYIKMANVLPSIAGPSGAMSNPKTQLSESATEAFKYVTANRPSTTVGATDLTMAGRTYDDLAARGENYDDKGNLVVPGALSSSQKEAYVAIAAKTREIFAAKVRTQTGNPVP
jgi:hypothetical protein